jgi:hypothetical protein
MRQKRDRLKKGIQEVLYYLSYEPEEHPNVIRDAKAAALSALSDNTN